MTYARLIFAILVGLLLISCASQQPKPDYETVSKKDAYQAAKLLAKSVPDSKMRSAAISLRNAYIANEKKRIENTQQLIAERDSSLGLFLGLVGNNHQTQSPEASLLSKKADTVLLAKISTKPSIRLNAVAAAVSTEEKETITEDIRKYTSKLLDAATKSRPEYKSRTFICLQDYELCISKHENRYACGSVAIVCLADTLLKSADED